VNDSGQVAGFYSDGLVCQAFLWDGTSTRTLSLQTGQTSSVAYGINDDGVVVGYASDAAGWVPVYWQNNVQAILPGGQGEAYAINDDGQMVGRSVNGESSYACTWTGEVQTQLCVGHRRSGAYAINNSGQAAGFVYVFAQVAGDYAAVFSGGETQLLGRLTGYSNAYAYGINDGGLVVGTARGLSADQDAMRAFIWQDGAMADLNTLLPDNSGWTLLEARDINNNGEIVGYGYYGDQAYGPNVYQAFVMTPVPEPSAIVTLLCGLAGAGAIRRRRGCTEMRSVMKCQ
jgi:probable HAF family extracellular repeat protein